MTSKKLLWVLWALLCLFTWHTYAQEIFIHECDRLAAHPNDINKVTPGISWIQLEPKLALMACKSAVQEYPEVIRFTYQYARTLHKAGDFEQAVIHYRSVAEKGYARAQAALVEMYLNGKGVAQDYAEAARWLRKVADQGDPDAQHMLGIMHTSGEGVAKDYAEAEKWFRKAADQGHPGGQYMLGVLYVTGESVEQDYPEAVRWYRKAADQGEPNAQYMLGIMHTNGEGVAKDETKAVEWYRKAAEQGLPTAQHELGRMYFGGQGVTQDKVQAYMWIRLAAARRHKPSKGVIDSLAAEMTSTQIAEAQRMAWEWDKKHAGPLTPIDFESESGFVVIDQSVSAYTVFTGISKKTSEQERDELKSKISEQEKVTVVTWAEFIENARKLASTTIVKHEYMEYGVIDGIVCLVGKAPGAPWGLTWNGGIALTSNDYQHAREIYLLYKENPEKYKLEANRDPRADPINPGGHLPAFGCL